MIASERSFLQGEKLDNVSVIQKLYAKDSLQDDVISKLSNLELNKNDVLNCLNLYSFTESSDRTINQSSKSLLPSSENPKDENQNVFQNPKSSPNFGLPRFDVCFDSNENFFPDNWNEYSNNECFQNDDLWLKRDSSSRIPMEVPMDCYFSPTFADAKFPSSKLNFCEEKVFQKPHFSVTASHKEAPTQGPRSTSYKVLESIPLISRRESQVPKKGARAMAVLTSCSIPSGTWDSHRNAPARSEERTPNAKKIPSKRHNLTANLKGPQFFAELCRFWPDLIARLAHDITLDISSPEDSPSPSEGHHGSEPNSLNTHTFCERLVRDEAPFCGSPSPRRSLRVHSDMDETSDFEEEKPRGRKRRKLPQIPHKTSFSTASIAALKAPTLAQELYEAEFGIASRASTPEGFLSRPLLVLKCHSYISDDLSSPESEGRNISTADVDSGHSTQYSPDGAKSLSPQATTKGFLSPLSPGSLSASYYPKLDLLEATHRGLYRFIPRHRDEMEIEIGDPIYVQREADDLWCEGVNLRSGQQGIFPSAHVTDVDYSEFDPSATNERKERFFMSYLGSIETLCHKGNQVLCQAVRKIARGKNAFKENVHPCILEVSDRGLQMVDKSRELSNEDSKSRREYFYHLKHVTFCGFHPKDNRFFGFITRHPSVQRFACHVFKSTDTTRPVAEAVGRAFQRFYQKFIETAYPIEDIYLE